MHTQPGAGAGRFPQLAPGVDDVAPGTVSRSTYDPGASSAGRTPESEVPSPFALRLETTTSPTVSAVDCDKPRPVTTTVVPVVAVAVIAGACADASGAMPQMIAPSARVTLVARETAAIDRRPEDAGD
jgi:hypothetical protein